MIVALVLFSLLSFINCDLLADRHKTVEAWVTKANSPEQMKIAFSDLHTTEEMVHIAKAVAIYEPREVAYEYSATIFITFGIPASIVFTEYDPTTVRIVTDDIWKVFFYVNFTQGYDYAIGNYTVYQSIFRSSDYVVFYPNSSIIKTVYTDFGSDYLKSTRDSQDVIDNELVCGFFIFDACAGSPGLGGDRPYLNLTNYTSISECVNFLDNLKPSPCPHQIQGNTSICRMIHGLSAILLPEHHCPHTRPHDSDQCYDQCAAECSNCHKFAECEAYTPGLPTNFDTHYRCKCKNGYVGNGTSCKPLQCSNNNCPAQSGSYNCSTGLCMCTDTFEHNPLTYGSNNLCTCAPPAQRHWVNGKFICLQEGRCVDAAINNRYVCNAQKFEQVKCTPLPNNRWTEFGICKCNYGFYGGGEFACQCPSSKRVLWSAAVDGEVCLAINECTESWHCSYPRTCHKKNNSTIGECSVAKRIRMH